MVNTRTHKPELIENAVGTVFGEKQLDLALK